MKFSGAILTAGLLIAVCAQQQPIIDKEYVPVGGMFTVTCDANRFPPGTIPSNLNVITMLGIARFVDGGRREPIAAYRPFPIPGFSNVSKFIPTGRNWVVEASGGVASGDDTTNNKATIKLELVVKDAKCSDAGIYSCNASSSFPVTGTELYANSQHLKASTEAPVITLDLHNGKAPDFSTNTKGQPVKLTCKFEGPAGLVLSWLTGPSGGRKFVPYPTKEDIQTVTPRPTEQPVGCGEYESTLTFKVPAVDTVYMCVVKDVQEEASRKDFKIFVKPVARNTGTPLGQRLCWNLFLLEVFLWSRFL